MKTRYLLWLGSDSLAVVACFADPIDSVSSMTATSGDSDGDGEDEPPGDGDSEPPGDGDGDLPGDGDGDPPGDGDGDPEPGCGDGVDNWTIGDGSDSSNGQAHQVNPLAIGPAPDAMQYGLRSPSHEFDCVEQ